MLLAFFYLKIIKPRNITEAAPRRRNNQIMNQIIPIDVDPINTLTELDVSNDLTNPEYVDTVTHNLYILNNNINNNIRRLINNENNILDILKTLRTQIDNARQDDRNLHSDIAQLIDNILSAYNNALISDYTITGYNVALFIFAIFSIGASVGWIRTQAHIIVSNSTQISNEVRDMVNMAKNTNERLRNYIHTFLMRTRSIFMYTVGLLGLNLTNKIGKYIRRGR